MKKVFMLMMNAIVVSLSALAFASSGKFLYNAPFIKVSQYSYRTPLTPGAKLILGEFDSNKFTRYQHATNKSITKPALHFLPHKNVKTKKNPGMEKKRLKQYFTETKLALHHQPKKNISAHSAHKESKKKLSKINKNHQVHKYFSKHCRAKKKNLSHNRKHEVKTLAKSRKS